MYIHHIKTEIVRENLPKEEMAGVLQSRCFVRHKNGSTLSLMKGSSALGKRGKEAKEEKNYGGKAKQSNEM